MFWQCTYLTAVYAPRLISTFAAGRLAITFWYSMEMTGLAAQQPGPPLVYLMQQDTNRINYGRPMEKSRPLYFCPVVSSSSVFFPLSNLSRRRLDVCDTCTHGVALVRI